MVDQVNIPNCFMTPVSGVREIDNHRTFGINLGHSGAPETSDPVHRVWYHTSRLTTVDEDKQ
jgi:hypothetical protein